MFNSKSFLSGIIKAAAGKGGGATPFAVRVHKSGLRDIPRLKGQKHKQVARDYIDRQVVQAGRNANFIPTSPTKNKLVEALTRDEVNNELAILHKNYPRGIKVNFGAGEKEGSGIYVKPYDHYGNFKPGNYDALNAGLSLYGHKPIMLDPYGFPMANSKPTIDIWDYPRNAARSKQSIQQEIYLYKHHGGHKPEDFQFMDEGVPFDTALPALPKGVDYTKLSNKDARNITLGAQKATLLDDAGLSSFATVNNKPISPVAYLGDVTPHKTTLGKTLGILDDAGKVIPAKQLQPLTVDGKPVANMNQRLLYGTLDPSIRFTTQNWLPIPNKWRPKLQEWHSKVPDWAPIPDKWRYSPPRQMDAYDAIENIDRHIRNNRIARWGTYGGLGTAGAGLAGYGLYNLFSND